MSNKHPILIKRGTGRRAAVDTVYIPSNLLLAAAASEMRRESAGKREVMRECGAQCIGWYVPARPVTWVTTPVDPFTCEKGASTDSEHQQSEFCHFYHYDGRATLVAIAGFTTDPPTIDVLHKTNAAVQMELYAAPQAVTRREGEQLEIHLTKYERDPLLRVACLAKHGSKCTACGLDFGEAYGPIADGFIHVHHLQPLAAIGEAHDVDPSADLVPLCPNCHSVAHMRNPPLTPEEVKALLRDAVK